MKYTLIVSIIINLVLFIKIFAMRLSIRDIRLQFAERGTLKSNTLLRISGSRDKEICALVSTINGQLGILRESFHKYEQGDRELKTAIANITHDLRTPLTAICGYLGLCDEEEKSPKLTGYLSIINERTEHMKKLTEELFEYSVLTGNETIEEKQEVFLNQVLEDGIMNFYPAFVERGIEPVLDITQKHIKRILYPSYVERIISNLLNNALKYSDGDLEVSLSESGRLKVANTAKNLSRLDVNRLFDRFYTVETARNHSTGLGLAIVKLFAERMGCELKASYEGGKLVIEIWF